MKCLAVLLVFMMIHSLHGDDFLKKIFSKSMSRDEINNLANKENKDFKVPLLEKTEVVENQYIIKFKDGTAMKEVLDALPQSFSFDPLFKIHHKYEFGEIAGIAASMNTISLNIFRQLNQVEYVEQDSYVKLLQDSSKSRNVKGGKEEKRGGHDDGPAFVCNKHKPAKKECKENTQDNAGWCLSRTSDPLGINTFKYPEKAGAGEKICVVDTGVNEHPDLVGRVTKGRNFVNGETDDDLNGHGTAIASGAAGTTVGVAKKAQIIAVKVFNAGGAGTISDVTAGLMYCALEVKKSIILFAAIALKDQFFNDVVDHVVKMGNFIANSAGNQAQDACMYSPPSSRYACTVAATTQTNELSTFTNFGTCVNMSAPGVMCRMAFQSDYALWTGTSMAAAYVAGWAAVVKECTDVCGIELCKLLCKLSLKGVLQGVLRGTPNRFIHVDCPAKYCCPASSSNGQPSSTPNGQPSSAVAKVEN